MRFDAEKVRARLAYDRLVQMSSVGDPSCWVQCPTHGRQARDPDSGGCVYCDDRPTRVRPG